MSESIVVALVAGGLSLIGTVVTVLAANKATINALDKKSDLSDAKLDAKLSRSASRCWKKKSAWPTTGYPIWKSDKLERRKKNG